MSIEVSATYENGVLKLDNPIPLEEHQRVKVTVREEMSVVDRTLRVAWLDGRPGGRAENCGGRRVWRVGGTVNIRRCMRH